MSGFIKRLREFRLEQHRLGNEILAENDSNLSNELYDEKVRLVEQELTNSVLQSKQIKTNINLTEEQTRKITVELAQAWESLTLEDERNKIEKFKAKSNAILGQENLKLREREMIINGVSQTLGTLNAGRRKTTTTPTPTNTSTNTETPTPTNRSDERRVGKEC